MFIILKLLIIFIICFYVNHWLKYSKYNKSFNNLFNQKHNSRLCQHSYEYFKIITEPTENEEGGKIYICKYCRNTYFETIPKLNKENYKIENLTSNCENGNGVKYYSELYGNYEVTDNKKQLHSIYGKKCNECHKLIGEFDFKSLGPLKCTGYPRLIRLSDHWNNNWLLGGNFGNNVGCRISKDQGLTWSDPIDISNFPDHLCSNIDLSLKNINVYNIIQSI